MASCSHPERLIPLLYDGELDAARRHEVAFQISDCPECTRRMQVLEHSQEILCRTLDEEVSAIDFSHFWTAIEPRLEETPPSPLPQWSSWFRLWRMQWQPVFSWNIPVWATAAALLIFATVIVTQPPTLTDQSPEPESVLIALNNPSPDRIIVCNFKCPCLE